MNPLITAFEKGIEKAGINPSKISVPSDIPFKPEVVKVLGVDYFHTIRGRAIPFGTGMKLANPALKVVPFVGDMLTIGGNHLVHSGRRNMDLLVICINNYVQDKVAGKAAPTVNPGFTPHSTFEEPFNVPHVANSCGAVYTARWTALHTDELSDSIAEALDKKGFSVIEILSPGPDYYTDISQIEYDLAKFYYYNSEIKNGEEPKNVAITPEEKIIVGKFTDIKRPTYLDVYNMQLPKKLGDKFVPYGV